MFKREDTGFRDKNGTVIFTGDYVQGTMIHVREVGVVRHYGPIIGIDWAFFGNDTKPDFALVEVIGSEKTNGDHAYPDPRL